MNSARIRTISNILGLLILSTFTAIVQSDDRPTTSILAHPAMFGKRWTPNVTAQIYTVPWDLCNETVSESDDLQIRLHADQSSLHEVALYFDPFERSGTRECRYATMAQVAEKKYPTAQYLLVANTELVAMTKFDDELDTSLSLATVTFEDGKDIKNRFGTDESLPGSILVKIDATSRPIMDMSKDLQDLAEKATIWITITQVTGTLSFLGSAYVICSLIGTKARRSKNIRVPFNRLLLAMSAADLLSSLAMMFSGLAIPTTPPGSYDGYYSADRWRARFPSASGNDATCKVQGSAFFTGYVAIQTLLVVRYGWTERRMQKAEYFFFASGIGVPLLTGIWAMAKGLFQAMTTGFCWIGESVFECVYEDLGPIMDEYCDANVSEDHLFIYNVVLAMVWIMLAMMVILGAMVSLYLFVRNQEKRASRWSTNAQEGRQQKRVLTKSIAIISAYFFTWMPTMFALTPLVDYVGFEVANIMVASVLPLQGFFNALIFSGLAEGCINRLCFGRRTSKETSAPQRASGGEGSPSLPKSAGGVPET